MKYVHKPWYRRWYTRLKNYIRYDLLGKPYVMQIVKTPINNHNKRRLKCRWTVELEQELKNSHEENNFTTTGGLYDIQKEIEKEIDLRTVNEQSTN